MKKNLVLLMLWSLATPGAVYSKEESRDSYGDRQASVNFLPMSAVTWGWGGSEAGRMLGKNRHFLSLSWPGTEKTYNFDRLASANAYKNSSSLSLSPAEVSMSSEISRNPDWGGLKSDTAHFVAYQFAIIGALYVMPASISGWTDETKADFSMQQYRDNVSQVVWDKDDWWLNYVLHPYWGGSYYVRAQERGFGPAGSFWYAVTLSSIYEFGIEAFFENPSIQDIIVTPVAGYFVGKYFAGVRANIRKRKKAGPLSKSDRFVMVITDPIGAMKEKVEGWFGKETDVSLRFMLGPQFRVSGVNETQSEENRQLNYIGTSNFGMKMTLRW